MRDRLIELIKLDNCRNPLTCSPKCTYVISDDCHSERLADHLLANGVIVPPVSVGQKVYIIGEVSRNIIECEVIGVWQCKYNYSFITDIGVIHTNSLGKTVFLTREEAEAKLKEE